MTARNGNAPQGWGPQFWCSRDYRDSLKVQAMDWAEEGMYRHLLDLAWDNDGLPSDLEEIRRLLGLGKAAFQRAWQRIGPCFAPRATDPTRLENPRQEKERAIRREIRGRRAAASAVGNAARWGSQTTSADDPNRMRGASAADADRSPDRTPERSPSVLSSLPSGPSDPGVRTEPSRCSDARAKAEKDDRSSSSGPAGREGLSREQAALWTALRRTPYRENSPHREVELLAAVRLLDADGVTVPDIERLIHRAKRKATKHWEGLFAHWIDNADERRKELSKR